MGRVQVSHVRHSGQGKCVDPMTNVMVPMTKDVMGQVSVLQLN